jgi:hypothetical protein
MLNAPLSDSGAGDEEGQSSRMKDFPENTFPTSTKQLALSSRRFSLDLRIRGTTLKNDGHNSKIRVNFYILGRKFAI